MVVSSKEATKWKVNQAEKIAFFVIEKLDLSEKDATFFKNINLKKIVENDNNIKESSATKQVDKKSIYAKG